MSKTAASQRDGVFVMLDSIRGFGAIIVMIAHTYDYWGPWGRPASAIPVDLFFMLSGFVIAYVYERRFAAGMSMREFALHRIVRLYPLYLVGALLGFAVMLLAVALGGMGGEAGEALRARTADAPLQLLMIPTPTDEQLYPLNPPAWTLFFELLVNLLYVAIWRWLSTPRLIALVSVFAVLLGISVFWRGNLGMGGDWATFVGGLTRSSFGFFMGVLIFRLCGSPSQPSAKRSGLWTAIILTMVVVITYLPSSAEVRPYLDLLLLIVVGVALIFLGARFEPPKWIAAPLATLGRISFALYIIHIPLYFVMIKVTYKLPWLYSIAPWSGLLLLAICLVAAYAIERWIDQPVRRLAMGKVKQWVKAGEWKRPKTGGWGPQMPTAQYSRRPPEAPPR
jgi:peptidoglycan/LPS O-acetylase OafA/YrhL